MFSETHIYWQTGFQTTNGAFFFFFNEMSAYVLGLKQCLHVGHAFFSFF